MVAKNKISVFYKPYAHDKNYPKSIWLLTYSTYGMKTYWTLVES